MNEQEVIRKLGVYASVNGSGLCTQDEYEKAKRMAIEFLEKQISKKPTSTDGFMRLWRCPSCKAPMGYGQSYCHCCGQKLDWTVEE